MVFIKDTVTHLHPKWCAHSIPPLAPRAKQPALHIHTCNQYRIQRRKVVTVIRTQVHWAVELDRFHLAAGGGERSGPNMLLWLLFSFMLGLCAG